MEQITVTQLLLYTWRTNKIHLGHQINRAGNTLLTESYEIIYAV